MISKVIGKFRRIAWRILGVNYSSITGLISLFQPDHLRKKGWVKIETRSYDSGADAWRNSPQEHLYIGKYCSIAKQVQFLCGAGKHDIQAVSTYPLIEALFRIDETVNIDGERRIRSELDTQLAVSKGPIIVGNDVWIGFRAVIESGVSIGDGAVIMPCAVVAKNIPPYAIAGGVPAKIIKYRFEPDTIEALLKIQWWNWTEELIKERIADFYLPITEFIEKYCGI